MYQYFTTEPFVARSNIVVTADGRYIYLNLTDSLRPVNDHSWCQLALRLWRSLGYVFLYRFNSILHIATHRRTRICWERESSNCLRIE